MAKGSDMQVVILCGGMGTRIRDVADDIPKPMILVGGKPILWHIMKGYADQGFRRFVLCLGYKGWTIKRFFLDYHLAHADLTVRLGHTSDVTIHDAGECDDWEVVLAQTGDGTMTAGRVKAVERYLEGDFLLTYGDGLSDVDVPELVRFHRRHGRIGTVTAVHAPGRFGEMQLERDGRVSQFSEKPPVSPGLISGGFFVFKREFLSRLPDDPSLSLEREPMRALAADGELAAYTHSGFWQCMDNSRDHQFLNELWDTGRAPWVRRPPPKRAAA